MKKLMKLGKFNRLNDKGLTLVEVMISITVFSILMAPIVIQLNTLLKSNQKLKLSQAETDYATRVMEQFKNSDKDTIEFNKDADGNVIYNAAGLATTKAGYSVDDSDSDNYIYTMDNVKIEQDLDSAETTVINKDTHYKVKVSLNSGTYATTSGNNGAGSIAKYKYKDPNDVTYYNLDNIDSRFAVIINDKSCNYDARASEDLVDKIALLFKKTKPDRYNQWINGVDIFKRDSYCKNTYIKMSKGTVKKNDGDHKVGDPCYNVTVTISYTDKLYGESVTYTLMKDKEYYPEETGDVPPSVYVLYNQYVQNNLIVKGSDTITIDNHDLGDSKKNAIKCYIVKSQAAINGTYTYYVRKSQTEGGPGDEMVGTEKTKNVEGSYVYEVKDGTSTSYLWPSLVTNTKNSSYGDDPAEITVGTETYYVYNDVLCNVKPSLSDYKEQTGNGTYSYVCKEDYKETSVEGTTINMKEGDVVYLDSDHQYVWPDGSRSKNAPDAAHFHISTPSKKEYNSSMQTNILLSKNSKLQTSSGENLLNIYTNLPLDQFVSSLNPSGSTSNLAAFSGADYATLSNDEKKNCIKDLDKDTASGKKRLYHITLELYKVEGSDSNNSETKVLTLVSGKEG